MSRDREARLEVALRHAPLSVASEIADLRAEIEGATATMQDERVSLPEQERASLRRKHATAQLQEREQWLASWDAALVGSAPSCDLCGQLMTLDERDYREAVDDAECGIPLRQWACFCNGGNYAPY